MMPLIPDDEEAGRRLIPEAAAPAERSWMDATNETLYDAARATANAVSFGMADRLRGYLEGTSTDEEVKKSEASRARSPIASVVGDVAGSVAIPGMGGARLAANLGRRFGPGALRQFGARALGYGAEGAGIGAAQGAGNTYTGNAEDYVKNAVSGGVLGGVTGGVMGGILGPRGQVSSARVTTPQQQHYANSAYDLLRANPTQYGTPEFRRAANDLEARLYQRFDPAADSAPASFRAVDRMMNTNVVTPKAIDDIRQTISGLTLPKDKAAAVQVRRALDDFLTNPPPGAVHPSQAATAREAAQVQREATDAYAGLMRSRAIENARINMENKTARANSGLNAENNLRGWADTMLRMTDRGVTRAQEQGYNAAERALMNNILHPGWGANTLRAAGNMMGGGAGVATPILGTIGAAGSYASGDTPGSALAKGAALAAGGIGVWALANRQANQRMQALQDLVGQRNPLYQRRVVNAPMVAAPGPLGSRVSNNVQNIRDALTYELMQRQAAQEGTNVP